jgi:plastocyanin
MRPRVRSSRRATAATATVVVAAVLAAGGSASDDSGETIRFDIPAGASKLVDAGRDVPGVPQRIEGSVGDTVEVTNHDSELQVVSGFPVSPGQTLRIPLNRAGTYQVECSAHKDDSLTMVVEP